jgi:polyisoprenyl-phosphate glycosyltransferase
MGPEISVVVPVYGCADCLRALHARLTETLAGLVDDYELVFVDDGSRDGGWAVVDELAAEDEHLIAIKLSRNFGQHAALTAGLEQTRGRWVVVMDCDLQHPPEEIPRLYATARDGGFDIVFTRRRGGGHSWSRRAASRLYFSLMNRVLKTDMKSDFSNFSIISRQVTDEFLRIRDRDRQYLMILYWLGFKSTAVEFEHQDRYAGRSTYSLASLVRFAFDGLFFQTTALLRWIVYLGFALSLTGAGVAAYFVILYVVSGSRYPGWTSLIVLLLVVGGFIIVSTGIAALYVGKIFGQVKGRPLFVVETRRNAKATDGEVPADVEQVHAS